MSAHLASRDLSGAAAAAEGYLQEVDWVRVEELIRGAQGDGNGWWVEELFECKDKEGYLVHGLLLRFDKITRGRKWQQTARHCLSKAMELGYDVPQNWLRFDEEQ